MRKQKNNGKSIRRLQSSAKKSKPVKIHIQAETRKVEAYKKYAKKVKGAISRGAIHLKRAPTYKETAKHLQRGKKKPLTSKQFEKELKTLLDEQYLLTRNSARSGRANVINKVKSAIEKYNDGLNMGMYDNPDDVLIDIQNDAEISGNIDIICLEAFILAGYVRLSRKKPFKLIIALTPTIEEFRFILGSWLIAYNYIRSHLSDEEEAYGS